MRPSARRAFTAGRALRENYYQVLGVSVNASQSEIKKRFHELSRQHHPDRNENSDLEKYQRITAAYEVLSNKDSRRQFDLTLGEQVRRPEGYSRKSSNWTGNTRARSGYQFHARTPKYTAHKDRANPNLDPLRPKHRDHSVNDTPHFDAARHFAAQQRADERFREARRQHHEAEAESTGRSRGPSPGGGTSPLWGVAGTAAASLTLIYLLFR